jgi:hypothetical protein
MNMPDTLHNGHGRDSFEQEDLSPQGIFYFMAGLAVVGVVIYFIVVGMYRFLDAYDRQHQVPPNPMAVQTGIDARVTMPFSEALGKIDQTFPKPVLEHSELQQFNNVVEKQDQTLASYDWVDQKQGIVRIPIDKAMELLVQRGLPVLPQGTGAQAAAPSAGAKETKAKPAAKAAAQ